MYSEMRHLAGLIAICYPAIVLMPRRLLCVPKRVGTGNVVVVAEFSATQAAEITLRPICASAIEAVRLLVSDPLHFKVATQIVP